MKKMLVALALMAVIAVVPAFSFGIGGAFGLDVLGTVGPGALFSFSPDAYPIVLGIGLSFSQSSFTLGATADWWLYHTNLVSILSLYIGPGAYLDFGVANDQARLGLGLRVPIGIQAWVLDPLELFLEVAPTFGMRGGVFPVFGVQGAIGFRFWF